MPATSGGRADTEGRQGNHLVTSRAALAVWAVLFCVVTSSGSAARGRGPVVRREAPFPAVFDSAPARHAASVQYEVLRGDFHMHALHSDGSVSPADRVLEAWEYGYDVIAITDHAGLGAYEEAVPMARALDVLLLRGIETGLSEQEHLIAVGFSADYEPRNPHQWSETEGQSEVFYRKQWQRLTGAGGFVFYAHPHVGLREPMLWGIDQGLLEGIEVYNGVVGSEWNTVESHGTYWYPFAFDWAVEYNLTIFANSDAHEARADTGQAVTLVLATDRSREAVLEALHAGRTIACFNNMLCGHEWALQLLMTSLIDVRLVAVDGGRAFLRLENHGPVELTAEIAGTPLEPVILGPYQKALASLRRMPDIATINWKNVYTRPTQNLTTTHTLSDVTP
ncbi:MAG: CehA/McbA family metallohydrolase [Phycisphaerales bacterium]|nr:MAG: CehA/McbA family metallohydrolase [Phycisphaerales bacterium]